MSELKRCLDNAYEAIKHESYNDALSSILEAQEHAKCFEEIVNAVAHTGVDYGHGEFIIDADNLLVSKARDLITPK